MNIYLISYGDENYASQKKFFEETALSSSFFDKIIICGPENLDNDFYAKFEFILNQKKGGGYWIWKPYLLKMIMNTLNDNDILVYCDVGCMINLEGKERFGEYIQLLMGSKTGSLAFELPHQEIEFTKQEVFDYFRSSPAIINSNQLIATVFLLKKCKHAIKLIDEWYNILFHRPALFTDDQIEENQHIRYKEHRHDQSLFSVIRKTYGSEVISDETYFLDFIRQGQAYPFWSTHLR
ncbi:hypothetical protein ACSBL2_17310 [Pedobacter sp. AW31-3R]|uniref:hypothetical protein n=1 Tax=Pedobacter sp. AW31-3R TaxID=3445781 RepID=UPI003FA0BD06